MTANQYRIERDSMGELKVPADALWGAQTQRAVENFTLSGLTMPRQFLRALALIKWAAAGANGQLRLLPEETAIAIQTAALFVAEGKHDAQFPVDVFQTGSGTSTNMNMNEVIAHLASASLGKPVHPNDDVNKCQSSNDVIPAAIHLAASLTLEEHLLPALENLEATIEEKAQEVGAVVKTGRTHLMDAMPISLEQELSGWQMQVEFARQRLIVAQPGIRHLALGGTAVGTGINAHPQFADYAIAALNAKTGLIFSTSENYFEALSSQDTAVALSGQLKALATSLMKIANDLRWMNSGPLAGLGEITLPALQPGSSIMPGKVNPVIPEALAMICAQVIGNDATITVAGQSGNFQLNVMLPVIAYNLLQSINLLANGARHLADRAIAGFTVNTSRIDQALTRNPILATALNPLVGYDRAAQIAKRAYSEGKPILEVAAAMTDIDASELRRLLDPDALTQGGINQGGIKSKDSG